jgi:hypothetical protein
MPPDAIASIRAQIESLEAQATELAPDLSLPAKDASPGGA